jgi:Flp pilus assembly protein TadG
MTLFNSIAEASRRLLRLLPFCRRLVAEDSRGTAAVEFGLVLPFMVVLLAGVADIGRTIWHHHTLQKGVQDAARYLSRVDAPFTAAQLTAAKNLLLRGDFDGSSPLQYSYWSDSLTTNLDSQTGLVTPYDNTAGTFRGPATINIITVRASVAAPAGEFPLLSLFNDGTIEYSARHQMRNIGE